MREEKTFVFEAFQRAWGIAEGQRFFVLGMCVCVCAFFVFGRGLGIFSLLYAHFFSFASIYFRFKYRF